MSSTAAVMPASPTAARIRAGRWMRLQRERVHLTRKQVSLGAEVAVNTVCEWEAGKRMPGIEFFIRWCRAAHLEPASAIATVELLLGGES